MRRLGCLLLLFGAIVAVAPTTPSHAADAAGRVVDFELLPPQLTVTAGDSITWTNEGARPHTVTDRGGMFDTEAILPGAQAKVTVDVPGTYEIFCEINPSKMNARLVVEPGDAEPTALRVQAFDEGRQGESKRFDPPELEVAAGSRLILANVGGLRHSLKAEDGSFAIAVVDPGDENGRFAGTNGSVVVDTPGTHAFFCEIHPAAMKGSLNVTRAEVVAKDRAREKVERPPPQASTAVTEFAFDPTGTVVAAGGSVTWTNAGSLPHTATFDDVRLDTGRIEPGKSAKVSAPGQPGTYSYYCGIHTKMRGVLIVSPVLVEGAKISATPSAKQDGDQPAGTVFAWLVAVMVVGVGVVGLALGARPSS